MNLNYDNYMQMVAEVRKKTDFKPLIAVTLGTGLGNFADNIDVKAIVNYDEITNLPLSTNPAHKGRFVFGYLDNIPLVLMQGRLHYYEGFTSEEATRPIRLMGFLGAKTLILSNAAGGINTSFKPGDFMLIEDHIDAFIPSPLRGNNDERIGPRFIDMSEPYNKDLINKIYVKAKELALPIQKGIYVQYPGPQFETKSLIKMFRGLGADACGMSTAIEAVASNHQGIKTIAISFISNMACGILNQKLSDEEVQVEAKKSENNLTLLLKETIKIAYDNL